MSASARMHSPRLALAVAAITTVSVAAISHLDKVAPAAGPYVGTLVGATFLLVVWRLVLRRDDEELVRAYGLSLGGITEPSPLSARRLGRDLGVALLWSALFAAIIFPPFWFGYRVYWRVHGSFMLRLPADWWDVALGQLLVVALPEEAFYRGYLQTALERGWGGKRWRLLGAELGVGWLVASAIFAVGHYLSVPNPTRLAVFFPALAFGWLRARTGGIGAPVLFHALCNLLTDTLARGYLRGS